MEAEWVRLAIWLAVFAGIIWIWRASKRRRRMGRGASGALYDLLNEDKRRAIEVIVEQRAEARDAEDAEGNLPDLASGRAPDPRSK